MRRILFIIIALALKSSLYAQDDYRPFVEEGKTWNYIIYTNGQESFPARLVIEGDTTIEDVKYKKVMHYSEVHWTDEKTKDFLYAVVREEDKKVYLRYFYESYDDSLVPSKEGLIYDFGLKIGDIFVEDFYGIGDDWSPKLKLDSIEEKEGMRIFFFSINNSTRCWVEGVGGRDALGLEERFPNPTCISCTLYFPTLVSCTLGDEVLCRFDDDGNVVLGVEEVRTDVNKDKSVYDLQGRRLNAEPSHGIYIKDGKKVAR